MFSTKRSPGDPEPIQIDGTPIRLSTSVKYLGVIIDHKPKFAEQANAASTKAKQRLYLVNRFKKFGASASLTKQLFSSFIESHLFYCLVIFFNFLSAKDRRSVRQPFECSFKMGLTDHNFNTRLTERISRYMLQTFSKRRSLYP